MRYQVTLTAVTGNPLEAPLHLGTMKVVAKDRAAMEKEVLDEMWDDRLDATCFPRFDVVELPRYLIVDSWDHIFEDFGNRTVRFIYDYETERLENLELMHATDGWVLMTENARKDVEDSLKNANEECLDDPDGWGYEASNDLPDWAKYVPGAESVAAEPSQASDEVLYPKVVVLCANASGEPEFHTCSPEVSKAAYDEGAHYALAKENAEDNGYEGLMLSFDQNDPAAKQLAAILSWLTPVKEAHPKAEQHWQHTANAQGWNEPTRLRLVESFLREKGLFSEFAAYASGIAEEENEASGFAG